ncbi:hypothetical protein [Halorubrum sp. HHNYT27]|uniref:hypothetical protein n=1 Tax=Halorubrum sp. HHNYT27 TaxID=3402275 RepID=UPI003EB7C9A3
MGARPTLILVGMLMIAGCTAPLSGSSPPEQKPFPTYPEEVTAESVGTYASQYEAVYRHNTILATADVETVTSITAGCSARNVTEMDGGFRVTVGCEFGWTYTDEGSEAVADGRPYEATYWVGNGLVERIGSTLVED